MIINVIIKSENQELLTLPYDKGLTFTFEQMNINIMFQRLWMQLADFMKDYINAILFSLPNTEAIAERLFKMPDDFYNDLLVFYGPEIANKVSELLTNFLASSSQVVEGVKSNNQELVDKSVREWYQNADILAGFLDSINLFWDTGQWRNLLYQYIYLKTSMIMAIATRNYKLELQIYERIIDLVSIMGTYMARGLIAYQLQQNV